jgi:DNA invertase Pin-like site-specific DNA recombinase
MKQETVLDKIAAHHAEQTRKRLERQSTVKKMYDKHRPIAEIAKKVGYREATIISDLRFMGYKIDRRKSVQHAMIKKWFLDGRAPKEIAVDLDCCLDTVYKSINEQVNRQQIRLQKIKLVYKERQAGKGLKEIAEMLGVAKSTVSRIWDERVLLSDTEKERLRVGIS